MSDLKEIRKKGMNTGVLQTYCGNPYTAGVIYSQCDHQTPSSCFSTGISQLMGCFSVMTLWKGVLEGAISIMTQIDQRNHSSSAEKAVLQVWRVDSEDFGSSRQFTLWSHCFIFSSLQTQHGKVHFQYPKNKTLSAKGNNGNKKETKKNSLL